MKSREKLGRIWNDIPEGTNVVVTHGPPKRILDLSENRQYELEYCGDSALGKRIEAVKPLIHMFGHVHTFKDIPNNSILYRNGTYYSNGSVVEDGKFDKPATNGHVFEINPETKQVWISN